MQRSGCWVAAIALGVFVGCADDGDVPVSDVLLHEDLMVPIPREASADHAAAMQTYGLRRDPTQEEFFLAIRRSSLEETWFWSVYQKQTTLFGPSPNTLGTKVVRFRVENDKLFVFDADIRRATSDVFSPDLIIDAFPIVHDGHFESLPGSGSYVLIDPAAGFNRFGALADYWASAQVKLETELSFVQGFRAASDGGSFDQIITTYSDQPIDFGGVNENPYRVAATMTVNIRRYFEGAGYQQVAAPFEQHYFLSEPRIIPNTGFIEQDPEHWNFHPGMAPIKWVIGREILALQDDPNFGNGADLFGSIKRGIESWNDVFGYPVFRAELAGANDSFGDDHTNYFIVDPDPSVGFAFADWRANPNTGEIRGASVYFSAAFFTPFPDDAAAAGVARPSGKKAPKHPSLTWQGMNPVPLCMLDAHDRDRHLPKHAAAPALTGRQKLELYVQHVAAHEVGHTLGLRHNFKGSFLPPTSSVMEYNVVEATWAQPTPGAYDRDAIRYLYSQSPDLPAQPFCTDEETQVDPNCFRFDDPSPTPLTDDHIPIYQLVESFLFQGFIPPELASLYLDFYGTPVYAFVRAGSSSEAALAWQASLDGARPPLTPTQAGDPTYAAAADAITAFAYHRLFTSDPFVDINTPVSDPTVLAAISADARNIIANIDGVRTYPTRRQVIDALKAAQDVTALEALIDARAALVAQLPALTGADRAQTSDLIARIDAATSPYFP